jgi:ABC-type enterochelin transport system ATPase subunit
MRHGRIVADGDKADVLTSEGVSELFDCNIDLIELNGYYQAVPAGE